MTEIKVFGKPKREIIEMLEQSLEKLEITIPKIYLAFARNVEDIRRYLKSFWCRFSSGKLLIKEKEFVEFAIKSAALNIPAIYLSKMSREENFPPIILVNLGVKIPEVNWGDTVFHEAIHLKSEAIGWLEIRDKADLKAENWFCQEVGDLRILQSVSDSVSDFLGYEIACQYNFFEYVLRHKKRNARVITKIITKGFMEIPEGKRIEYFKSKPVMTMGNAIFFAFLSNFPPSYKNRGRDQELLVREISPVIYYFPELFRKLALLPSQIKVPPEETNLLKIYGKIFEIYNDFLIRSSKGA